MAKIQLHYRHIAAVLLILSCFVVFTIIVLYDVTSKKSATNITVTSPKEEVVTKRIRTASKDVLRKPQVSTSTPVYTPNNVVKDILSEQLELIHGNSSDLDLLLSEQVDENPLLETLEKFVKSKQNKIVKISRDDFYVAAVIDFAPLLFGDVIGKVRWNADQYVSIIRECERYMVDIVVFPEMGLFQGTDDKEAILNVAPEIPPVEAAAVPCEDYKYGEILEKLSCAAKYSDMYVVATLMERYCSEQSTCSRRDLYLFLTTIVFDRNGTIIARYRKYNLHMDKFFPGVDEAREPELVVFNTDFNVTFGILSSFDLFFKHPAVTLIDEYGLTDIIVPSSLPTRLPFLAASSVPAGWSYVMDVNLLTSKSSDNLGAAGNNIFFGRRELTQTYMIEYSSSNIVIAPVPKLGKAFPYEYATQYLTLLPYGNTKKHYSYQIEHVMSSIKMESLYNRYNEQTRMFYFATPEFYCNITLEWEPNMMASGLPGYRMAAFNGLNNYTLASIDNYVEMCGLIQCSTSSDTICFLPPVFEDTAKITIKSLHLTVASRMGINDIRIPITLKSDLTVWDPSYYEYENYIKVIDEQEYNIAEMHLRNPVSNLVAFGVYKLPEKINPANSYGLFDIILNTDMVFG